MFGTLAYRKRGSGSDFAVTLLMAIEVMTVFHDVTQTPGTRCINHMHAQKPSMINFTNYEYTQFYVSGPWTVVSFYIFTSRTLLCYPRHLCSCV